MLKSCFFNSVLNPQGVPDRAFNADDFARYFGTLIKNGVFPNPSTNFQCIADQENMTVKMESGICWIDGHLGYDDNVYILPIETADSILDRIDRIVLRKDVLDREIKWVVKKGALSGQPVAPTLQRDADAWEIAVADIKIVHGTVSITQSMVTDLRMNAELCGWVTGVVTQIDTTTLFNQMEQWKKEYIANSDEWTNEQKNLFLSWASRFEVDSSNWKKEQETVFSNWSIEQKAAFDAWFNTIKDILDTNAAGNLQSQIDSINTKFAEQSKKHDTEVDNLSDKFVAKTLESSKWSGGQYSFESEYPATDYNLEIQLSFDATKEQVKAWASANINGGKIGENVVKANGVVPSINIPIILTYTKINK